MGRELAGIARGTSDRAPARADQRFRDPAWQNNPLVKRSMQAYLAANETVDKLFADTQLDWRDAEHLRFVLDVVMEGISPSNNPLISPLGWKAIIDTGGLSVIRGLRHFVGDMASPPRVRRWWNRMPSLSERRWPPRPGRSSTATRCSN